MKPNQEPDEKDRRVESALREWVVDSPLPPRFQEQVWQRIARTEARPEPRFQAALGRWLEMALPRPRIAFSYIAVLLVLGVAAGSVAAQVKSSHLNAALSARYVQSIDPYRAENAEP